MTADQLRLFFALPCPPPLAATICAWREREAPGGRPVDAANLHLTLAFLGDVAVSRLAALEAVAQGLKAYHAAGLVHRGLRPDRGPERLPGHRRQAGRYRGGHRHQRNRTGPSGLALDHLDMGYSERTGTVRPLARRIADLDTVVADRPPGNGVSEIRVQS